MGFIYIYDNASGLRFCYGEDDLYNHHSIFTIKDTLAFSALIHRTAEEWNKNHAELSQIIHITNYRFNITFHNRNEDSVYPYYNYQSQSLTAAECALLHCLLDIFEKEHK